MQTIDTGNLALLIGAVLPPLIALVQQSHWSSRVKNLVAVAIFVLVGAVEAYYKGELNGVDVATIVIKVAIAAKIAYETFWKPTGITPAIEKATTIGDGDTPRSGAARYP